MKINDEFEERTNRISREEIEENESPYGNSYVKLTKKDIEHLKKGGIIVLDDGEYSHFFEFE